MSSHPRSQRAMLLAVARFVLLIAAVLTAVLLASCGPAASGPAQPPAPGQLPPPLSPAAEWLNTPEGQPLTLAGLKGRVVVMEFFAAWCPHCQEAEPGMVSLAEAYAGQSVTVLGVHTASGLDRQQVQDFLTRYGATYPVALDVDGSTYAAYGITGVPTVVLLGTDGRVRWVGYPGAALRAEVDAALAAS